MSPSPRNCYKNVKVRTVVWLVYLFVTTSPIGAVWERNHYYRLEEDLLSNYSPTVRPVLDVNTVTNVSISFLVLCVYEVSAFSFSLKNTWCMCFIRYCSYKKSRGSCNTQQQILMLWIICCRNNKTCFHEKVDEMVQAMTQNSYMALTWFDELLQWDPQEYGGVASTEFSSQKVWLPVRQ